MARARRRPGEFELIAKYFRPLASAKGAFALTDDAAVFAPKASEEVVVTCDAVAEGIHFFRDDPPGAIAQKALRVNLSDLAAKGATPVGYLMTLALPSDWTEPWLRKFAAGLAADERIFGIPLLGGDTIRASGGLTISITALGVVPKGTMVRRAGARPGDAILVSGTIGDAALGLRLRRGSIARPVGGKRLLDRYLLPEPRVDLAPIVRKYATSAIDVSDGLIGDLGHICDVSEVGAEISLASVPMSEPARRIASDDHAAMSVVLNGGDDYEILCTVPPDAVSPFRKAAAAANVAVTPIGYVVKGKGPPIVTDQRGRAVEITGRSHSHF